MDKKKIIIYSAIGAGVLALGGLGYWLWKRSQNDTNGGGGKSSGNIGGIAGGGGQLNANDFVKINSADEPLSMLINQDELITGQQYVSDYGYISIDGKKTYVYRILTENDLKKMNLVPGKIDSIKQKGIKFPSKNIIVRLENASVGGKILTQKELSGYEAKRYRRQK